ncbi:MAG: hypothetical protein QW228_05985 [Candidatus Aenigmatarchaeota archaeon]
MLQDQHHHHIEFALLDPFNVSFYSYKNKKIYIDQKFKNSKKLDEIIKHEVSHQTNPFTLETLNFSLLPEILRYKPLHILQILFPFALVKTKEGKFFIGIDPLGIISLLILIITISFVMTFRTYYCATDLKTGILTCYECRIFSCKIIDLKDVTNIFNFSYSIINYAG